MKPLALIIEDDPEIREVLADRLESLGHDHHAVGSHVEARERLGRCSYTYVLLDLELPVRFGRPTAIEVGKNILREIRTDKRHEASPIIVVTAHGHDRPDLAVEVMKAGATDFVKKPFENLEAAIREALDRTTPASADEGSASTTIQTVARGVDGGRLVFFKDRLELNEIEICTPDNGVIWRILLILRERRTDGRPKGFPGKLLADSLGLDRGQNAVCDAVSPFRRRVIETLGEDGIHADGDSVIINGRSGYQINPELEVEDRTDQPKNGTSTTPDAVGIDDRCAWFIEQLEKGRKMRRADHERHFRISMATAKRDIRAMEERVEFVGTGSSGYYVLKR